MHAIENKTEMLPPRDKSKSIAIALVMSVSALLLAGCGGGTDGTTDNLNIGVVVAGSSYSPVYAGQSLEVSAPVGQPIEFDANEPVDWSFAVNGSPLFANGTTVDVGGVTITQQQLDPSRVVLLSNFYGPALLPIDVTLTATSTIDAALVVTIHLHLE